MIRRLWRAARWVVLIGVVLTLAALLAVRALLPRLDAYRPQVEDWVSAYLGQRVSIGAIDGQWSGWVIELRMRNVRLLDDSGRGTVLELKRTRLTVDPVASLRAGSLLPGALTVTGASIAITREHDGSFSARGLEDSLRDAPSGDADARRDVFVQWILAQRALTLESATILWEDRQSERAPIVLTDVNVRTRYDHARHTLSGSAILPRQLGKGFGFDLSISGDPTTSAWSGTVSLRVDRLNLGALASLPAHLGVERSQGAVGFEVATTWQAGKLQSSEGRYRFSDLALEWADQQARFASGEGSFTWHRTQQGWRAELSQEHLLGAHGEWPAARASVHVANAASIKLADIRGQVSFVRVGDLWPLVTLLAPQRLQRALAAARVGGTMEFLRFSVRRAEKGKITGFRIAGHASGVSLASSDGGPSVSGLSGDLQADLMAGRIALDSQAIELTVPGKLPRPVRIDISNGDISWVRRGSGWWVNTSGIRVAGDDFSGEVAGKAHWPFGNRLPIVDLTLRLDSANLATINQFLPIKALRPRLGAWLERSVKRGRLRDAKLEYRGYAGDFPFKGGKGSFAITANIDDLDLDYSPRWPAVSAMQAVLDIAGTRMRFKASSGEIFGTRIGTALGTIADLRLHDPTLRITGHLLGAAQRGIDFLRDGALKDRFAPIARRIAAQGDIDIGLDLSLVLPAGGKKIKGNIKFDGNRLAFSGVNITLEDVAGEMRFAPSGVFATGLGARYLSEPVVLDIGREPDNPHMTRIEMAGSATREFLSRQLVAFALLDDADDPPRIVSGMSGETRWRAILDLPDGWGKTRASAPFSVESSLAGLDIALPYPFAKPGPREKRLRIESSLTTEPRREVRIRYGADTGGVFELASVPGGGFRLLRGAVVFGDPAPDLRDATGLYVGGHLATLAVDDWAALLTRDDTASHTAPRPHPVLNVLDTVEIGTGALRVLGQDFKDAEINVTKSDANGWLVRIKGKDLQGEAEWPAPGAGSPVIVNLEHLSMAGTEGRQPTYDPRRVPPIKFSCKRFVLDDIPLGTLKLATSPAKDGMHVDTLIVIANEFEASASGAWTLSDGKHQSRFTTELHADDLGKLLSAFGYQGSGTSGGATDIRITSAWPGSPAQFSLADVRGVLNFRAGRGRLLELNPGTTGRVFGFMMITSLPRRLKLDFTDLFGEGISYDRIEGSFAIEGGNAYTNNLTLESESARIDVAGRTGLVEEDYDQIVTVTPKLTSSLPLAPIWLIEKVFKKQIFDKVFSYQYTVTGPWDNPEVERIAIDSTPKIGSH